MSEGLHIKEELFSLYKGIKNDIPNDKLPTNRTKNLESGRIDSITLISYIKESIPLLINHKISEAISNNTNNNNDYSIELELNNKNKKFLEIKKQYLQMENQLKKLENDNKYYLKRVFQYKIQKDILEMKLNAYMSLEDEYEELKEKVKYEGGKFLDNERKDNEIIILRSENSALKKEIVKFENMNKKNDNKNKEYIKRIKDLQTNIENLNKKIFKLEKIIKEKCLKNKSLSKEKNNSCVIPGVKYNENTMDKFDVSHKMQTSKNYYNIKNIKALYPQSINFKNKRMINFNSPKSDIYHLEKNKNKNNNKSTSTINAHFLGSSTYNRINQLNSKKIKYHLKNDFNSLKNLRNNSITIIKVERDESKSLSVNKNNIDRNKVDNLLYKSGNKMKSFNKILCSNPHCYSPMPCKSFQNDGKLTPSYLEKEMHKKIINNFSQSIRAKSNDH